MKTYAWWVVLVAVVMVVQACGLLFKQKTKGNGSDTCSQPDARPAICEADGGATFACGQEACCADGQMTCLSNNCEPDLLWTQGPVLSDTPPDSEYDGSANNGTVIDNATGLMWQQMADGQNFTYMEALTVCANLNTTNSGNGLGGCSTGWRLPEITELLGLADLIGTGGPAINSTAFPGLPENSCWSNTINTDDGLNARSMNLANGDIGSDYAGHGLSVLCVRSQDGQIPLPPTAIGAPPGRYVVSNDGTLNGTVFDVVTGLTWQQYVEQACTFFWSSDGGTGSSDGGTGSSDGGTGSSDGCAGSSDGGSESAQDYCSRQNTSGLAGLTSGWRLPTVKELASLVDFEVTYSPAIDRTAFPGTPGIAFWTATPYGGPGSEDGWVVDFGEGETYAGANHWPTPTFVRCVR